MRHFTLVALLSTAGLIACHNNPLGPTQTGGGVSAASPGSSATPGVTGAATDSLTNPSDSSGDCVQTGENTGQCGSQATDSTSESPETAGESPETAGLQASKTTPPQALQTKGWRKAKQYNHERDYGSEQKKDYGSHQEKNYGSQEQQGYGSQQ